MAAGKIGSKEAILLAAGLSLCAFLLILPLNQLTILLSVPALFLAGTYPFTKRFFAMPQAYLGIAFSFGIPMAFAAQTNSLPPFIWILMLANLFWVIAYDTAYAIVDKPDDLKIGIKESAIGCARRSRRSSRGTPGGRATASGSTVTASSPRGSPESS